MFFGEPIPCNVDLGSILIDKLQPIRSLGSQSCDEEYEALAKGSKAAAKALEIALLLRVGGATYLIGWTILGSKKARLESMVVD